MRTYTITQRMSKHAKSAINNAIETHEKYKKAFFWNPGTNSGSRRYNEKKFPGEDVTFIKGKDVVELFQSYSESARNCYYTCVVYVNGEKKNIRVIKNLIK